MSVKRVNLAYTCSHLLNSINQKTRFAICYYLVHSPTPKSDNRAASSHSLNHHHAKRLFPQEGIQQCARGMEQTIPLMPRNRANIANLLSIQFWFNLLPKVLLHLTNIGVNRTRKYQG